MKSFWDSKWFWVAFAGTIVLTAWAFIDILL